MDVPRQLSLLKGRRQKGELPPPPLEDAMHIALADILRISASPDWRWTYMPFGEFRRPATAGLLKRKGVTPGWPDFMFINVNGGAMAWLELKRPVSGRASPAQRELAEMFRGLPHDRHVYAMMSSVTSAVAWLKANGICRARVT